MADEARSGLTTVFRALADTENPSCMLSPALEIVRVNAAWAEFARANGGTEALARCGRGASLLEAVSGELREFYRGLFARAHATGERVEHDYECSTDTAFRQYRMTVFPVAYRHLVVTHSLRIEKPLVVPALPVEDSLYVNGDQLVRMCSNCRRVHAAALPGDRWDWVAAYVACIPRNTTHGLCPACAHFYYA